MQDIKQQLAIITQELQKMSKNQSKGEFSSTGQKFPQDQLVNNNAGEIQTKSIKLECPVFNGEDPNGWIHKANLFFHFHNTPPQFRMKLVFHMEGKALTWFQDLDESGLLNDWDMFVKALLIHFGPNYYDDPIESLMRPKQR